MTRRFATLLVLGILALAPLPLAGQAADVVGGPEVAAPPAGPPAPLWAGVGEDLLWDNGPFANVAGSACPSGTDTSRLQSALGLNTYGFGHAVSAGIRVADDFTVPDGPEWQLSQITFFAYQTGSTTASTITAVNAQIWDGSPDDPGSSVVCGDTVTNCMSTTVFTGIYRDLDSAPGACNRPVMAQTCDFSGCVLPPGNYWLDWQTDGSLASGPWVPPITITGQAVTGDGQQSIDSGATWAPLIDTGTAGAAQGLPFLIEGTAVLTSALEIPALAPIGLALLAAGLGAAAVIGMRRRK